MTSEEPEKAALPEYPADWFTTHNSHRVSTIEVLDLSDQVLGNTIHGGLKSSSLPAAYAVNFLYGLEPQLTLTNVDEWVSFEQTIVGQGGNCNPLNLLKIIEVPHTGPVPPCTTEPYQGSDLALAVAIALNY